MQSHPSVPKGVISLQFSFTAPTHSSCLIIGGFSGLLKLDVIFTGTSTQVLFFTGIIYVTGVSITITRYFIFLQFSILNKCHDCVSIIYYFTNHRFQWQN